MTLDLKSAAEMNHHSGLAVCRAARERHWSTKAQGYQFFWKILLEKDRMYVQSQIHFYLDFLKIPYAI